MLIQILDRIRQTLYYVPPVHTSSLEDGTVAYSTADWLNKTFW